MKFTEDLIAGRTGVPKTIEAQEDKQYQEYLGENTVDLVATGYSWVCPFCSQENEERGVGEHVACYGCSHIFKVGGVK